MYLLKPDQRFEQLTWFNKVFLGEVLQIVFQNRLSANNITFF